MSSQKPTQIKPFRKAAVLGAGVMGSQIAAHLANAGLEVFLLDIAPKEGSKNDIVNKAFAKMLKMKPSPVVHSRVKNRIKTGNFDEHLDWVSKCDWVIEVIIEQLDAKKSLMAKLEKLIQPGTVVSTNTSGLPVHKIIEDCSDNFKKHFLGTHFFNPPRYLKLLELIPTEYTDPGITNRVAHFGRVHLGKGIVTAKDTPNFIANRIGTYSMMLSINALDDGYTIEEIDALTGLLTGRPKSATFRTADVVGLDTLMYVSENLHAAIPEDEERDTFKTPKLLKNLVQSKRLGSKTRAGFYKKEGGEIKSVNAETLEYESAKPLDIGNLESISGVKPLSKRWKALFESNTRAGEFIRKHTAKLLAYSMNRMPEISDYPADVDHAIMWGFGWDMGPFHIHDWIGSENFLKEVKALGLNVPAWYDSMQKDGNTSFYKTEENGEWAYVPGTGYKQIDQQPDQPSVAFYKATDGRTEIWNNEEAGLIDSGDGVLIYEFRSKSNTLGAKVIAGLMEATDILEKGDYRGMVIANDGKNFSVGANLGELAYSAQTGDFKTIERAVYNFQMAIQRIRYASKPVVCALRGRALGGGCEITMGADNVVAATETYIGLVELGVGLIPAGTGTMHMAARAMENAATLHVSHIQPFIQKAFETIAMAKVATSAHEAIELGYFKPDAIVVMNEDRRIHAARQEVIRLYEQGYIPPAVRTKILVTGKPGYAALSTAAWSFKEAGYITEYDAYLAKRFAHVLTGGDLNSPAYVHEDYLIDLEREVIVSLAGEKKTQERIHSILTTNKPLRN